MDIEPASVAQVRKLADGRRIVIDNDVSNVARDLRAIHPSLKLRYSESAELFVVLEADADGGERLIFTAPECDQRIVKRAQVLAHQDYDYARELDKIDQAKKAADEYRHEQIVGGYADRLAHAFRKDRGVKDTTFISKDIG